MTWNITLDATLFYDTGYPHYMYKPNIQPSPGMVKERTPYLLEIHFQILSRRSCGFLKKKSLTLIMTG
jgi:hypothetical protein